MVDPAALMAAYEQTPGELLRERTGAGPWIGELASSALSTATAVSALAIVERHLLHETAPADSQATSPIRDLIVRGLRWLCARQNDDGGFGDTDRSHSNIA